MLFDDFGIDAFSHRKMSLISVANTRRFVDDEQSTNQFFDVVGVHFAFSTLFIHCVGCRLRGISFNHLMLNALSEWDGERKHSIINPSIPFAHCSLYATVAFYGSWKYANFLNLFLGSHGDGAHAIVTAAASAGKMGAS